MRTTKAVTLTETTTQSATQMDATQMDEATKLTTLSDSTTQIQTSAHFTQLDATTQMDKATTGTTSKGYDCSTNDPCDGTVGNKARFPSSNPSGYIECVGKGGKNCKQESCGPNQKFDPNTSQCS